MQEDNKKPIDYDFYFGASPDLLKQAKVLRANQTESEKRLWHQLKNRKVHVVKWRRQHPAYRYIFDFYCHRAKLAIEIDGDIHSNKESILYDNDRDTVMEEFGVKTIRFSDSRVMKELELVEIEIQEEVRKRMITL